MDGSAQPVVNACLGDATAVLVEDVLTHPEGKGLERVEKLAPAHPLEDPQQRFLGQVPGVVLGPHAPGEEEPPELLRQSSEVGVGGIVPDRHSVEIRPEAVRGHSMPDAGIDRFYKRNTYFF